jgi:hypothetical protein
VIKNPDVSLVVDSHEISSISVFVSLVDLQQTPLYSSFRVPSSLRAKAEGTCQPGEHDRAMYIVSAGGQCGAMA